MQRRVIVGVFGATTGLTVAEFSHQGGRVTDQKEIPWIGNPKEGIYWPMDWLSGELDRLRSAAGEGDVIALAMPGADLCILPSEESGTLPPVQHYRGVMDGGFIERATATMPAPEIYRRTNGANVAAFQPYAQLLAYEERHPGVLNDAQAVVPLSDWMTLRLSGRRGHDPVMLQDQGLANEGRQVCGEVIGLPGLAAKVAPWRVFGEGEVLRTEAGAYVVPVTHDSVPARNAGYSAAPWVVWTGTWIGTACRVEAIRASALAYEAGFAFEGAGPSLSAITNVGMLGRTYKALVQRQNMGFEEVSARIQRRLNDEAIPTFDVADLPADEEEGIRLLMDRFGTDMDVILSAYIASTAAGCRDRIRATASVLDLEPPQEVAVIGGWSRNAAFLDALQREYGRVKVPAQAADATAVGLAADALVRVGDAATVGEALGKLPEIGELGS
ncbi:MAG: hypothetical protein KY468_01090 [Armatimonadetes bacterium]|nr:hypothetical protein [Armatimonadota bacterium]